MIGPTLRFLDGATHASISSFTQLKRALANIYFKVGSSIKMFPWVFISPFTHFRKKMKPLACYM